MSLEDRFYELVTPEGKQNYVMSGDGQLLLELCKKVDELESFRITMRAPETATQDALIEKILGDAVTYLVGEEGSIHEFERALRERLFR